MYTIYLTLALSALFVIFRTVYRGRSFLASAPVFAGCAAIGLLLSLCLVFFIPMKESVVGPLSLASARSADGITGSFVMGRRHPRAGNIYHLIFRNDDGSFSPYAIAADNRVRIIEDASLKGVGYLTQTQSNPDWTHPFAKWCLPRSAPTQIVANELRVPVGSVVQTFAFVE